jgi:hypothetical protein
VGCVTSPCLPALPWKRACCRVTSSWLLTGDVFQRCCVTSSRLSGEDSASLHRRAACILSRVVYRTLPSNAPLRNPCRATQQLVDMSHYSNCHIPDEHSDFLEKLSLWYRVCIIEYWEGTGTRELLKHLLYLICHQFVPHKGKCEYAWHWDCLRPAKCGVGEPDLRIAGNEVHGWTESRKETLICRHTRSGNIIEHMKRTSFKDKSYLYDIETNVDLEKAFSLLWFKRFSIWFAEA